MEQIILNQKLANIGINGVIRHRYAWLAIILIIVVVCGLGLSRLQQDSSNESFLPESDALYDANERFKEQFGNEEFVFILIRSEHLFSHETLSRIRALQQDLETRLPFVDEVNTISNVEYMESQGNTLLIDEIVPDEIPTRPDQLEQIRQKLASSRLYVDRIITADLKQAGIGVSLERMPKSVWVKADPGFSPMDQADWPAARVIMANDIFAEPQTEANGKVPVEVVDPRKLIAPALRVILADHQTADFQLVATGMPVGDFEVDRITIEDGSKIGLIAGVAAFLFILVLYRNITGVFAPLLVMSGTVVILFGGMGWLKVPVSLGSMIVAPLLMVLSVSYSIHYINHFNFYFQRKGERLRALHYAYSQSAWPCFLTAATTAIGFASFLIVSMKPIRDVGIACGAGTLISFVLVMILVPICYSFGKAQPTRPDVKPRPDRIFPRGMVPLANFVLRVKVPAVLITVGCCLIGMLYGTRIPVETDLMKLLGEHNTFVKDSKAVTDVLGGYYSYEVMIELNEDEAAKKPELLQALATLNDEARRWHAVRSTMSLVDLVKELNYVMNGRNPDFYVLPDNREQIAQYLLLYEISGGSELDNWVDYTYRTIRLSVQLADSVGLDDHIRHMQLTAKKLFPEQTTIHFVGDVPIMLRLMNLLTIGQLQSIIAAFVVIALVMVLILKSVRAGLIAMIPNFFPVLVIAGIMGLFKINLDIMTIMIAPMVIGIAVDDTVHFFIHFQSELAGFRDYHKASRQTFVKIGHAIIFTSVVLSLGFGILGFSQVSGIVGMGFLAAVGILSALLADIFITPVLLVYLKPFGKVAPEPGLKQPV